MKLADASSSLCSLYDVVQGFRAFRVGHLAGLGDALRVPVIPLDAFGAFPTACGPVPLTPAALSPSFRAAIGEWPALERETREAEHKDDTEVGD